MHETGKMHAVEADAVHIASLHRACFPNPWPASDFQQFISSPQDTVLIARNQRKDRLAGCIVARHAADEAEILTVMVDPDYRRSGIGADLLKSLLRDLVSRQVQSVFLEVSSLNEAAIALYNSIGFRTISIRKNYYRDRDGNRHSALVMNWLITCGL